MPKSRRFGLRRHDAAFVRDITIPSPCPFAGARKRDIGVQNSYWVKCPKYWYSEDDGTIFCLCEAPNKEAAGDVHREAHGVVADEIIEVTEGV